jgi:hypothetical protein
MNEKKISTNCSVIELLYVDKTPGCFCQCSFLAYYYNMELHNRQTNKNAILHRLTSQIPGHSSSYQNQPQILIHHQCDNPSINFTVFLRSPYLSHPLIVSLINHDEESIILLLFATVRCRTVRPFLSMGYRRCM